MVFKYNDFMDKSDLFAVPVPQATATYAPVPHKEIYEGLYDTLQRKGYKILTDHFTAHAGGNQLIARLGIESPEPELGFLISFRNSYDKSMSVGFAAGAIVWACGNGMVRADIKTNLTRKHTGGVIQELHDKIDEAIHNFNSELKAHVDFKNELKDIELPKQAAAELIGRMFIEKDILNTVQLQIVKKEMSFSENFKDASAWSLYNHCTEALKTSHATEFLPKHIGLHKLFEEVFI